MRFLTITPPTLQHVHPQLQQSSSQHVCTDHAMLRVSVAVGSHLVAALVTALVASLTLFVSPSFAASDPVRSSLDNARKSGVITGSEHKQFIREWNASASAIRSLIRQGKVSRAREVAANRSIVTTMARRKQMKPERVRGIMGGVRATVYVFTKRPWPRTYQRFQFDWDPVTYGYYPGQGVAFQPLFTMARANDLYFAEKTDELVKLTTRLEELKVSRAGGATWEYNFSFAGGSPPWVSGMAQGQAASVLARTYKRTQDPRWVGLGEQVVNTFEARPSEGGFTVPESGGRWYLLYSFAPQQRVLNGHLQAIIGLTEFQRETVGVSTKNELAQVRANEGSTSALALLPRFDTGGWSRYQLGQESDLNYHDLMTEQLDRLGGRLNEPRYDEYAVRFSGYRYSPPIVSFPASSLPDIYPAPRDRFRDSLVIPYRVNRNSSVVVRILDASGKTVRSVSQRSRTGSNRFVWDGRVTSGRSAPAGTYTAEVRATDIAGNRGTYQLGRTFVVRVDSVAPVVTQVRITARGKGSLITVYATDTESPWIAARISGRRDQARVSSSRGVLRVTSAINPAKLRKSGDLLVSDSSDNVTIVSLSR